MNTIIRLVAGTVGAGVLAVAGAGLAAAAPSSSDKTSEGAAANGGHLTPEPGGTQTYLLDGVAAPLPDPTLGVPDALRAAVTPLALLSDVSGESAPADAPQSVADAPGASQPSSGSGGY